LLGYVSRSSTGGLPNALVLWHVGGTAGATTINLDGAIRQLVGRGNSLVRSITVEGHRVELTNPLLSIRANSTAASTLALSRRPGEEGSAGRGPHGQLRGPTGGSEPVGRHEYVELPGSGRGTVGATKPLQNNDWLEGPRRDGGTEEANLNQARTTVHNSILLDLGVALEMGAEALGRVRRTAEAVVRHGHRSARANVRGGCSTADCRGEGIC